MKVEQLGSLSVPQVEAESENLHKELTDLCSSMKVHQENLLAMLKIFVPQKIVLVFVIKICFW